MAGEALTHGTLEKTDTHKNDEATTLVPVNKLEQSTPVGNSNGDTAHASKYTDKKEDSVINKNNEPHPAPQVTLVGISCSFLSCLLIILFPSLCYHNGTESI